VSLKYKLQAAFYKKLGFGSSCVFNSHQTSRNNIIPKETKKKLKLYDKEHTIFCILFISLGGSGEKENKGESQLKS